MSLEQQDDDAKKFSLSITLPPAPHAPLKSMAIEVGKPMATIARVILADGIRRWIREQRT
jgi:hypothetical protein